MAARAIGLDAAARGAEAAWALALARAARDKIALNLSVTSMQIKRQSLTELLELPAERAMITVLEGPNEGLGLLVLSPEVLAGMIEMQTVGQVSNSPAPPRRPTRTDASMVAGLIDDALIGLETALEHDADLVWVSGFRYASFLEDARPLGLLLEDVSYRILTAEVSLSEGAKTGQVLFAVPANGQGRKPLIAEEATEKGTAMVFAAALEQQILGADAVLQAVLARVTLPIQAVLQLKSGDPVYLGSAALDQIDLEGGDGLRLAGGKLGQNRGMRAVRLAADAAPAARVRTKTKSAKATHHPVSDRAAG